MDRSPETNRVANASSSSPSVQESPFSNFLRNLTPIDTAKNESYAQRLLGGTLPTPPVVFTSPHVSLHRETSYLERNDIVEAGSNVDVYKQCNTTIVQNPSFEKEVQLCSAAGCIDEYLSYPEEVNSINSTDLLLQPANEVSQLLHGGSTTSKESNTEVHSVIDGSTKNEALTSLNHAEEFPTSSTMKGNESTIDKDLVSQEQSRDQKKAKSAGNQDQGEENAIIQSSEDLNKRKGNVPKASVKKVSQQHRGIRRHLQFETSSLAHESTNLGNAKILCGVKHDTANLQSPSNLLNSKSLASSDFDNKDSSSTQALNRDTSQLYSCPYVSARPSQIGRTSSTSTPICSGPGLHLNRIAISTSTSSDMFLSKKSTGYLSTPAQMFDPDYKNNIQKDTIGCFISAVPGEIYSSVGHGQLESHTAADTSSFTFHCTDQIQIDQLPVPGQGNTSQDAGKVDELNHLSQKGKRRRSADISESCKRCNCKKSKCLKLYCECFAAGVFCLDSCSCENCYNKPEFEDTVFDARQQIESRNPLAFAPKVLKHEIDSPANFLDEGNWATPSSARHKRGCNCKKSKCLKRYCECFQAKVQCSSACRCDGCKNSYGTKAEHEYNRSEKCESHHNKKLDTIKGGDDCTKATNISQYSPSWDGLSAITNFTPLSNPCSSMKVSSATSSMISCQKNSQAQLQSSGLQPSTTGQFKWGCTPVTFTPQVYEIKGNCQLSADGTSCERMDDDTPEMLKETSNPAKVVKANSPNQKRISPPQSRAQRSRSHSPTGMKSGRKFVLQAMPSFPPLSPYSDAKDAISDTRNGRKGTKN